GERSYSIYLWHWPVFVLTQPHLSIELRSPSLLVARLAATLILAEISFRLVENRFRRGQPILPRLPLDPQVYTVAAIRGWISRLPRPTLGTGPYIQRPWARPATVIGVSLIAIVLAGGLPIRTGLADADYGFEGGFPAQSERITIGLTTPTPLPT